MNRQPNASAKSKEVQANTQSIHICKTQTINYMYRAKLIKHKNQKRIAVYFENKAGLIARFKKLEGATWSNTLKIWHLPDTEEYRKKFKLPTEKHLSIEVQHQTGKFVQWLRSKRYSESTIKLIAMPFGFFCNFFRKRL